VNECRNKVDAAREACLNGTVLTKEQIVDLLSIEVGSQEDQYLRESAFSVAEEKCDGKGLIWSAVGMDYDRCAMNCRFCSFGEKWGLIKEKHICTEEEVMVHVSGFVEGGTNYVILRCTEFFQIDDLLELVKRMRERIPGTYRIVLNAGEFDLEKAQKMADAGVYGVYKALRLREGIDTNFDPACRLETMRIVRESRLELISLVEPIGIEHSDEELAERFLTAVENKAVICGAMARIPVKGTPLGELKQVSDEKMAHIIAVLRLSGGNVIRDICVHPATQAALTSGANLMVVETGAIPRDTEYSPTEWANVSIVRAREILTNAGWKQEAFL